MPLFDYVARTYYNAFGGHEPALSIRPGDTVRTGTLDAHGYDEKNMQAAATGNPLTGPFYIEGARPGDAVSVRLDTLEPNRQTCWSHSSLAPSVVDPNHVPSLPAAGYVDWVIEPFGEPNASPRRVKLAGGRKTPRQLSFPLAPMLGCIGVAPPEGQVISSLTSGRHGGNMDWRGTAEGAILYFPVFAEGGLLYVGDGHACQGDGEVAGSGVEVSFDVQFTVDVIKDARINWPRGEDARFVFTIGNARPLDQALQHATTEMLLWLGGEHGFSAAEAGLLLGFASVYDVGNVFDPAYTVACKLPKEYIGSRDGGA